MKSSFRTYCQLLALEKVQRTGKEIERRFQNRCSTDMMSLTGQMVVESGET